MLIRTAWGLMFKHTAVGRSLGGRSHLCLVEPHFVLDLLPLLLRHAPEFNGWKEESDDTQCNLTFPPKCLVGSTFYNILQIITWLKLNARRKSLFRVHITRKRSLYISLTILEKRKIQERWNKDLNFFFPRRYLTAIPRLLIYLIINDLSPYQRHTKAEHALNQLGSSILNDFLPPIPLGSFYIQASYGLNWSLCTG